MSLVLQSADVEVETRYDEAYFLTVGCEVEFCKPLLCLSHAYARG